MAKISHSEADTELTFPRQADLTGSQVGDYLLEEKLDEGGFGVVYRAVHPMIGKEAAVKVLSRELSSDRSMVSRFVAEARAVNTIRHPNIIDIFNFGTLPSGHCYFIMELLNGGTLSSYLNEHSRVEPHFLCAIMSGVAQALEAAHAKGIIHRDLKPENVFLHETPDGIVPKLLDFGIAKLLGDARGLAGHQTHTGTPLGTPAYMAPEQCLAREVDARTDVYAFGVVCFEGLTGMVPFDAPSLLELMNMHAMAERPKASQAHGAVSPEFDEPIRAMMARRPDDRPQTVLDAYALLADAASRAGHLVPEDSQRLAASGRSVRIDAKQAAQRSIPPVPEPRPRLDSPTAVIVAPREAVTGQISTKTLSAPEDPPSVHDHPLMQSPTLGATVTAAPYNRPRNARVIAAIGGALLAVIIVALLVGGDDDGDVPTADPAAKQSASLAADSLPGSVSAPGPTGGEQGTETTTTSEETTTSATASPSASASAKPKTRTPRGGRPRVPKTPPPPKTRDPFSFP